MPNIEPVNLTDAERETLAAAASLAGVMDNSDLAKAWHGIIADVARYEARQEIASLAALVLRRSQDMELSRVPERNEMQETVRGILAEIFGEALADFSGHTKGDQPGA
jgi:hypothetical protein